MRPEALEIIQFESSNAVMNARKGQNATFRRFPRKKSLDGSIQEAESQEITVLLCFQRVHLGNARRLSL